MRKLRYFSDGVATGSKAYIESVFEKHREQFGAKRKTGSAQYERWRLGGVPGIYEKAFFRQVWLFAGVLIDIVDISACAIPVRRWAR